MKRFVTTLILVASVATAHAQIVIDELPLPVGIGAYTQYNTSNEDGSNSAAINALIAQSGANQVYDLSGITYEDLFEGPYAIVEGAEGPGAEIEPLDQATRTLALPFNSNEEDQVAEGVIYDYVQESSSASYNLGGFFEGTLNGNPFQFSLTRSLPGDPEFIFPMTFGSMWEAEFTEFTTIFGSTSDTDLTKTYEVDGWGTMLVPDVEEPIEVLRVKTVETRMIGGFEFDEVCYDLRANGTVAANFCEGDSDKQPTANVTVLVPGGVNVEEDLTTPSPAFDAVFPNPARESTVLRYRLPESGVVTLSVYDVLGRTVQTVVQGTHPAGAHEARIDVAGLVPGLYVARLQSGDTQLTRSFTVVR